MISIKSVTPKKDIFVIDGVFDEEQLNLLQNGHNDLKYGWMANKNYKDDQGHWNKYIAGNKKSDLTKIDYSHDETFMNSDIFPLWQKIQMLTGGRKLTQCYINGYTYGTDGYVHTDVARKDNVSNMLHETILIYCNQVWDINYGGETVFFSEDKKDIVFSSLPKKNRIVIFDASIPHVARTVSRNCKILRKVLVFKTIRRVIDGRTCIDFIKGLFGEVNHSGSDFANHLLGTADILSKANVSSDVCAAALFHAIYGTEYFKHSKVIDRDTIKSLIGDYAENLAYLFGTLKDRTNSIINNTPKFDQVTHYHLACIEYANLSEQFPRIGNEKMEKQINQLSTIINL